MTDATWPMADRLFAAIEAGDLDTYRSCVTGDFTSWTNFDDRTHDLEASCRILGWMLGATSSRRYGGIRRHATPGGFAQQHVLRVVGRNGAEVAVPACILATVAADGRISRMEEYLDPAPFAALT